MKVFIALGSFVVLALLALLIGPIFIDWTAYRTQFEAEASRLLGQRVEVRGSASARLLPFPSVTFADVVVGEPSDPSLTIRSFRMDAELAPYLSGEIRIFDMRLDGPRLNVPVQSDGSVRWPIAKNALGNGASVILEHVAVTNGSVLLEDRRTARKLLLDDVDAQMVAQSLSGPFSGTASLSARGESYDLTLATGQVDASGAFPVRLTTASARADVSVALDAIFTSGGDRPLAEGELLIASPLAPPAEDETLQDARPSIRATSALKLTAEDVSLSDIRVELGDATQPYVIEGSAAVSVGTIPHFDVTLRGQATDFDRLAPPPSDAKPSFRDRLASLQALLQRLPVSDIPGRVQASLPLLTVGDTALRDVSFTGSPTADGWSIETLSAELPGRSRLEASGIAQMREHAAFKGSLLLAVRQPAAFFTWAGLGDAAELVALSRAGFSAQVELSGDTQRFDALELDLDGGTLNGSLQRTVRPEGTVNLVDLKGGHVDLRPLAAVLRALPDSSTLDAERFDVQFDAGPVTLGTYGAQHLAADFTLQGGTLDLADATADDFAGASIHAEGTIGNVFGAPRPDLGIDLLSETPDRLLSLLRDLVPDSPLLRTLQARSATLAPLTLAGTLASPPGEQTQDLLLALSGTVGGTTTDLRLALENGLAAESLNGRFGIDATFRNDDPAALLAQFGRPALAIDKLPPLQLTFSASGTPDRPIAVTATATSGDTQASANGNVTLDASGIVAADTDLRLASGDAGPWLTTLGIAAGQTVDRLPTQLVGKFTWTPESWRLSRGTGTVADESVAAELQASSDEPVRGEVSIAAVSAPWLERVLLGSDEAGGAKPFGAPLLPSRGFAVDVEVGRLDGAAERQAADLRLLLSGDGNGLVRGRELSARVGEAELSGEVSLRNVAGLVNIEANGSLRSVRLRDDEALTGELGVAGSVAGAGRSVDELLSSLNGSGAFELESAQLRGLSPDVMTPVALAADSQTAALDAETVARLVRETGDGAQFPLGSRTVPFQIGAGVLRIGPLTVASDAATLDGEAAVTLATGGLSGALVLKPKVADPVRDTEPPRIDYRLSGSLDAPILDARTEALTGYFGIRAFQREQARVEALREELSETARLRREARLYRERDIIRFELRERRLEAEETERRRRIEEDAARERAAREAARSRMEAATPTPLPSVPDLSTPILPEPSPMPNVLPGVRIAPTF